MYLRQGATFTANKGNQSLGVSKTRMYCFNLFMYLWAANDQGQSCPLVQIPDTMIIHNGQPIAWLFTDRATGLLLKKSSLKQRDFDAVYKSFSTGGERDMGLGKVKALHVTPHDMAQHKVLVNHMDAETLYSFLKRKHFKDGLLQKFMMPFGKRNVVYSAFWYPNFFYLERTIMNARPRPLAEFDYPFVSKEKPLPKEDVSLLLRQRLQAICNSIVDHIYDVSPQKYKIAHMRLIFKNDIQGHLWLLFCYDLRLQREISIQRISHTSPTQQQLTSSHRSSHESDGATQRPQSAGSLGSGMGGDMQLKASEGTMKRSSSSTEFNHPVGDRTGAASGIDKYDISKRDDGSREDYHRDGYGMKSGWELKDRQGSRETRGDSGAAVQRLRTETDFSTNYSARLNRRSVLLYQPAGYLQAVSSAAFGEDSENKTLQAQHRHSLLKDISWVATTDVVQSITEELAEEHEAHQLKRRRSGEVDLGGGDEGKSGAGAMLLGQVKIAKSELGGFGFHGIGVHSSELQFPSAMGAGAGHQPSRPGWLLSAGLQAGGRPTNLEGKERRVDEHEIAAKSQAPPDDAAHMVENRPRLSSSDNEPDQEFGGELTDDETNLWWTDYEPTRIWLRTRTRDVNRRTLPWFEPFHYRGVVPMPLRRKSSRERARFPRLSPGHHYSSSWQRSARLQSGASVRSSMHSGWSMMDHGNHDAGRERESFRLPSTAPGSSVLGSNGDIGGYGEAHLSSTTEFPPMTLTEGVRGQRDGHEVEANYHAQGNFEKQGDHNHDHNHHNHHHHHHYRHMPQHVDTATAEHDDVEAPNPPPAECNHHVSSSDTGHNGPDHEQVVRVDPGKSGDDTSKGVVVAPRSGSGRARKRLKQDRNWFRKGGNGGRRRKDVEQDSKRREQSSLLQSSTEGRTAMGAVSSGPSAAEHIAQTVSSPSSPDLVLSSNPSSILTSPPNTSWEKQEDFSRSDPQHEDPSTGTGLHSSSKLRHHSKELSSDANLGTDIPSPKTLEVDGEVGEGGTDAEVHIPAAVRDQLPNWEKWWESITEVDWVSEAGIGDKFRRTFVETPRKPGFPRAKWPPEKGYTVKDQRKQESKAEPKLFTDEPLGDLRMKASSSGYRGLEAENGSDAKRSYTKTAADPSIEGGPTSGITDAETGQLTQNPTSSVSGQGPSSAEFSGAAVPNAMKNTKLQSARKDDKAGMHYIRNHGRQGATTASYPSMYRTHAQRSHASSGRNRNPPIHSPQRVLYTSSHNGGPASTTKSPGEIDTAQTEAYQELRFSTARTTGGNVEFENTYSPDQSQTERHDYSSPHDLFVGASFKPTRTAKPSTRRVRAAGAAGASRSQHLAKAFGNNIEIDELASWAKSPHKLFDLPVAPEREAWRQEVMDQISYLRGNPSVPRSPTGRGECSNRGCPSPYARLDPLLLDLVQGSSSSRKKIKLEIMKAKLRPVSPMRSRPFTMPGTDHAGVEWELFQETITAEETRHPEVDNGNFSKAKERTPVASGVQSNRWEIITVKETRHAEADRENFPKEKERTPVASGVQNNQQETVTVKETRHAEVDREKFPKEKERTPVASGVQNNQQETVTVKETRHAEVDHENFPKAKERAPVESGVQSNQQETITVKETRHTEDDRESFPKAKERTPVASGEQTNQRQQQHIPEQPQCGHELLHSKEEKAMLVPPTLGPGQEGGPFSLEEQALATVSPKEVHTEQHKRHEAGVEKDKQNVSPIVQQGTTGQSTKKKKTKLKLDMSAVRSSLESEKEESDYNQKLDLHLQEAHHGATSAAANSLKKNSLKNAEPDNRSTVAVTTAAAASASGDIQRASSEVIRSAGHKDTSKSHAVTGRKSSKNSEDHLVPRPGEENYLVILQSDEELSRLETVRLAEYVHPASTHDVLPIANQKGPVRRSTQSGSMKSEGGQEHGLSSASTLHDEHHHRATENIGGSSAQKRAAVTLGASASGTSALYSEKEVPTRVGETQSYTPGSLSVSSKSSTEDRLAA